MEPGDREWTERVLGMQRKEIEGAKVSLWYLSFATEDAFLGAAIVSAFGVTDAISQSHKRGINPGGSVAAIEVPAHVEIPAEARNRLLSREELSTYFGDLSK